ncbi:MAG: VOC family protein [Chitinophagaceae bacterium]|nr:VOC family protein [Chitinophagaceae bacterium]
MFTKSLYIATIVSFACLFMEDKSDHLHAWKEPYGQYEVKYEFDQALYQQNQSKNEKMKLSLTAGVITSNLQATKEFYTAIFGFNVVYESDWFLLMSTADGVYQISFLQPDHPSQQKIFQPAFDGRGMYFTIEVENVDDEYMRLKEMGVSIEIDLREEAWGDRHFAIVDPNGIGIDIVTYTPVN